MSTQTAMYRDDDGTLPAYAWPGGYQVIYYTRDGGTICPECANREVDDAQAVTGQEIFYEGSPIFCDDCNVRIQSAYGDPDDDGD